MKSQYWIDGTEIKRPSEFKIDRYNVTNLARVASGQMKGDLIAKKRTFTLTYNVITSDQLGEIFNIIWEKNSLFFTFEYIEDNVKKSAIVYSGALPTTLVRTGSKWVWKDVSFSLIEQ